MCSSNQLYAVDALSHGSSVSGTLIIAHIPNQREREREDKKLPEHSQRRFCYYELRGGLHDFAMAAAKMLKRDGKFCNLD